ncbi:hypothetical protein BsIDN1_66150 [Bacillus safensis]|uniref:Uncharacterized protein n=1 Tax=Bacillus safensis TaxID=561879 RepID=A0A5S9MHR8_BACIA|nr:hypothetical protein BsIDN1_66150 [Bacillus safensis]
MDERILTAVQKLADGKNNAANCCGRKKQEVEAKAKELGLTLDGVDVYDPHTYEGFLKSLYKLS